MKNSDNNPNPEHNILVMRPTMKQFQDFPKYIQYVESLGAHKGGICKIIPPKEWLDEMNSQDYSPSDNLVIATPIEQTFVHCGSKSSGGVFEARNIKKYSQRVSEFREMANSSRYKTPLFQTFDELERKYWKSISYIPPIYGADVNGSLFGEEIENWNVSKLDTCLDIIGVDSDIEIAGVTSPYLYFGMWRATFPWHTEDMDLYSINYIHNGAPKTWYSISPEDGKRFETFASGQFPMQSNSCPAFLRHKTSMVNPNLIRSAGIKVRKMVHNAGEFMITFPFGYHSGFNHGFNIAESTNFALPRWIKYGKDAVRCYCTEGMVQINMELFKQFKVPSTKNYFNEIPRMPDFDLEAVHWREKYGIQDEKPLPNEVLIKDLFDEYGISTKKYFREFIDDKTPNEIQPCNIDISNVDSGFKVGDIVYAKRSRFYQCAKVIGVHSCVKYAVEIKLSKKLMTIDPDDIMSFDHEKCPILVGGEEFEIWDQKTQSKIEVGNKETIKTTTYFLRYDDLSENLVPEADVWESLEKVPDSLKIPAKPVSTKKRGPPIGTVRKSKGGKKTTVEKS